MSKVKLTPCPCINGDEDSSETKCELVAIASEAVLNPMMNFPSSHYYGVVKRVSSLAGQWPYQNPKTKLICLCFVTLSTFSIIIPQVIDNP